MIACRVDNAENGTLEDAWDDSTGTLVAPVPAAQPAAAPTDAAMKPVLKRSASAVRAMKRVESMISRGNSGTSNTLDAESYYSMPRGLRANSVAAALADLGALHITV